LKEHKDPNRPYYTVPLWYPYFFIALGTFFFVPLAIAFNLFTTSFIFDQELLLKYGSTFPAFFYCKKCLNFTNQRVCPHGVEEREQISGTKLRTLIQEGQSPSEFILRPEISKIILRHDKPFVD